MNKSLIQISIMGVIGLVAGLVMTPKILTLKDNQTQARSAQALLIASQALQTAEKGLGYLPTERWAIHAESVVAKELFEDPNKSKEVYGCGWGINTHTLLRNGETNADPEKRKREDLPQDAILLMAWPQETFTPFRNGELPQLYRQDGTTYKPWENHGKKTPVVLVNGRMEMLYPFELRNRLRYQSKPASVEGIARLTKEEAQLAEIMETNAEGYTSFAGYITLEKGVTKTPAIESRGKPPIITFEAQSPIQQELAATIVYLNKDGKEINYVSKAKRMPLTHHADVRPTEMNRLTKGFKKPGFNPEDGHAETLTHAAYQAGTEIIETENLRIETVELISSEWIPITVSANFLPEAATSFRIEFEKAGVSPLVIRDIRIKFRN